MTNLSLHFHQFSIIVNSISCIKENYYFVLVIVMYLKHNWLVKIKTFFGHYLDGAIKVMCNYCATTFIITVALIWHSWQLCPATSTLRARGATGDTKAVLVKNKEEDNFVNKPNWDLRQLGEGGGIIISCALSCYDIRLHRNRYVLSHFNTLAALFLGRRDTVRCSYEIPE